MDSDSLTHRLENAVLRCNSAELENALDNATEVFKSPIFWTLNSSDDSSTTADYPAELRQLLTGIEKNLKLDQKVDGANKLLHAYLRRTFAKREDLFACCKNRTGAERVRMQLVRFHRRQQLCRVRFLATFYRFHCLASEKVTYDALNNRQSLGVSARDCLLAQLKDVSAGCILPNEICQMQLLSESERNDMAGGAVHCIDLMMESVEALLWCFSIDSIQPSYADCVSVLNTLQSCIRSQLAKIVPSDKFQMLTHQIIALVIRIMQLDLSDRKDWCWGTTAAIESLLTELGSWPMLNDEFSAFYLIWALVFQCSDATKWDSMTIVSRDVYTLLEVFMQHFDLNSLTSDETLVELLCKIVHEDVIAEDIWMQKFEQGVPALVRDMIALFPAKFEHSLKLATALCEASPASCDNIITLVHRLGVYSEFASGIPGTDLTDARQSDDGILQASNDRLLTVFAGVNSEMMVAKGTLAQYDRHRQLIQWLHSYNGFHVCAAVLRSAIQARLSPDNYCGGKENGAAIDKSDCCIAVLNFVATTLRIRPEKAEMLGEFLQLAVALADVCRHDQTADTCELIAACVRCVASLPPDFATDAVEALKTHSIIPTSSHADFNATAHGSLLEMWTESFLLRADIKIRSTDEAALISYWKVFSDLMQLSEKSIKGSKSIENQEKSPVLPLLHFSFSEIVPRLKDMPENDQICAASLAWLRALRAALMSGHPQANLKVRAACTDWLKSGDIGLIRMLVQECSRALTIDSDVCNVNDLQISMCALAVVSALLDVDGMASVLVQCGPVRGNCGLVHTLAAYVVYGDTAPVVNLALVCLRKMAICIPAGLLSALGGGTWHTSKFVGVDSSDNFHTVSTLLDAIALRVASDGEPIETKVLCMDVCSAFLSHQPALADLLLHTENSENCADVDAQPPIIATALELLKADEKPAGLLLSAYRVLVGAWRHPGTPGANSWQRAEQHVWPALLAPLMAGDDAFFPKIVALVLEIVSEQISSCNEQTGRKMPQTLQTMFRSHKLLSKERLELLHLKLQGVLLSKIDTATQKSITLSICRFTTLVIDNPTGGRLLPGFAADKIVWAESHWKMMAELLERWASQLEQRLQLVDVLGRVAVILCVRAIESSCDSTQQLGTLPNSIGRVAAALLGNAPAYCLPVVGKWLLPSIRKCLVVSRDVRAPEGGDGSRLAVFACEFLERILILNFNTDIDRSDLAEKLSLITSQSICTVQAALESDEISIEAAVKSIQDKLLLRSVTALLQRHPPHRLTQLHVSATDFFTLALQTAPLVSAVVQSRYCEDTVCAMLAPRCAKELLAQLERRQTSQAGANIKTGRESSSAAHLVARRLLGFASTLANVDEGRHVILSADVLASMDDAICTLLTCAGAMTAQRQSDADSVDLASVFSAKWCLHAVLALAPRRCIVHEHMAHVIDRINDHVAACCLGVIKQLAKPTALHATLHRHRSATTGASTLSVTSYESATGSNILTSGASVFDQAPSGTSGGAPNATSTPGASPRPWEIPCKMSNAMQIVQSHCPGLPPDDSVHTQRRLIELLQLCLQYLRFLSPDLVEMINDPLYDVSDLPLLLDADFASGADTAGANSGGKLTFGALLLCAQMAVSALRKLERSSSPATHRHLGGGLSLGDRHLLAAVLEQCIDLLLSQAVCAMRHAHLQPQVRNTIRREVAVELGQVLSRCLRVAGVSPSRASTAGGQLAGVRRRSAHSPVAAAGTSSGALDPAYIKFAYDMVQQLQMYEPAKK